MAGNSCSWTCNVKGADGKVKVSALWKGLDRMFRKDRNKALAYYFLTKNLEFLDNNSYLLGFDPDGEVTIESLKEALGVTKEFNTLEVAAINNKLAKEEYAYKEALDEVLKFNRKEGLNKDYLAILNRKDNGKYTIEIVDRTPTAEDSLTMHLRNRILTNAVVEVLKSKGLSVDFLDNPLFAVQYNTQNVESIDGYYAVAQVLSGTRTSVAVADAAGQFLAAAMKNSPLVQRLMDALTPEVQAAIFSNKENKGFYRDDFLVSDSENARREAAGILIGKQLLAPFEESKKTLVTKIMQVPANVWKGIKMLLSKIGKLVRHLFKNDRPEDIRKLVNDVYAMASTAAQGFISDPAIADAEAALATPTTYKVGSLSRRLEDNVRRNVVAYNELLRELRNTVSRVREATTHRMGSEKKLDVLNDLNTLLKGIQEEYGKQMDLSAFARGASLEGMVVTLEGITQILEGSIQDLLDEIQPSDRANYTLNLAANASNMRTVSTALKNIGTIYLIMQQKLDSISSNEQVLYSDANDATVAETIKEAVTRLGEILVGKTNTFEGENGAEFSAQGLMGVMELKRRQLFIDNLRDFFGSDFIEGNAGIVFTREKGIKNLKLEHKDLRKTVADFVDSLDTDITYFDRYFSSAADCADLVTAIGQKQINQANLSADRLAFAFAQRIDALEKQMFDVCGSTDWAPFMEVIDDGKGHQERTGNFVSQVNYGAWEKAREEFKEDLKARWKEHLRTIKEKAYAKNKNIFFTDQQLAMLYHNFIAPEWEKFHKEHSEEVEGKGGRKRHVPNHIKYHNQQWDNLFDTKNPALTEAEIKARKRKLKWYNEFMEFKETIDSLLPTNATVPWRMPQMTGKFSHRYKNLKAKLGNKGAAFGHAVRTRSQDWFRIREDEAWMFGSNNEFNEFEDDPLENNMYYEREKINRLPIYGVNKLKDMSLLSTDVFGTMLQYGSMAATYNAMEQVADVFEIGKDVLKSRRFKNKGNKMEKDLDSGESRAYARYLKFCEKSVYNINVSYPKFQPNKSLYKMLVSLSSFGSRMMLAGNFHGGWVNTGTGMFEIFKEAAAGENFNFEELRKAHGMYYSGLFSPDGYFGTFVINSTLNRQRPDDKNSLWIRHWNILSHNRAFLHNQRYDVDDVSVNRLWDWFGHTLMLPYSSGDHYMQTIPYYAMGIHEKVYTKEGKRIDLIDAYEIVDGDPVEAIGEPGKVIGKTQKRLQLKKEIFRSGKDILNYNKVMRMQEKIANYFLNNPKARLNDSVGLDMFAEDEVEFLKEIGLAVPTNVRELNSLDEALAVQKDRLQFNEEDESAFMDKCRNICNRLHGIYNAEDKVTFQQNFYGNLVMSMRGYALGMVNRRYAESKYNVAQRKVVEGNYNTLGKVIASCFLRFNDMDNWVAVREALFLTMPIGQFGLFNKNFSNKLQIDMIRAGFSPHQYYNMRRVSADFLVLEGLFLSKLLGSVGAHMGLNGDDDDSISRWALGLLYYFSMRWFNEQAAFIYAPSMWKEANTVLDYMPAGISGILALGDLLVRYMGVQIDKLDGEKDEDNSFLYYQQSKKGLYEKGEAKYKKKFRSLCPYLRSYYALANPYATAAGYEYGRRLRGR